MTVLVLCCKYHGCFFAPEDTDFELHDPKCHEHIIWMSSEQGITVRMSISNK